LQYSKLYQEEPEVIVYYSVDDLTDCESAQRFIELMTNSDIKGTGKSSFVVKYHSPQLIINHKALCGEINFHIIKTNSSGYIDYFMNVEEIDLSNNKISKVSGLSSFSNLNTLVVTENLLTEISLEGIKLNTLYLNDNFI
jgi:hypothetical protein